MQIRRADLADFAYFIEVARHRSFRHAATELGVTPSTLSHAMRGLEERLGVRLLNRTTRSVTLTAAGADLLASIQTPFEAIGEAAENLNRFRETPAGRVRINVLEDAATLILAPVIPIFVDRYPDVELDISVNNRLIDVIESGFDAGVRYGGTVPEDMIAQPLSADIRWMAAASPAYLEQFGQPDHPSELGRHRCVGIKLGNNQIYDWEFERDGEEVTVEAGGHITVDTSHALISLGLSGVGIVYGVEPVLRPHLEAGTLKPVLSDWSPMGPGCHIYYSSRRQVPTGLRLLIDLIRELKPLGL